MKIKRQQQGGVWAKWNNQSVWVDSINTPRNTALIQIGGGMSKSKSVPLHEIDFGYIVTQYSKA